MPNFDHTSANRAQGCCDELIRVLNASIKKYDFRVMCGHRNQADQELAYKNKTSPLRWPNSKHNKFPSDAVDLLPNCLVVNGKIDWNDKKAFEKAYAELTAVIMEEAGRLGIKIRWGGTFKRRDLPHYEIMR